MTIRKKIIPKLTILVLAIIFSMSFFASSAKAFPSGLTDWAHTAINSKVNVNLEPIQGLTNNDNLQGFCQNDLFSFQSNNLFVGTFCDLGSILAISTGDFATNVTCTIQSVAMSNYDNSILFKSQNGTCQAEGGSARNDSNVFGTPSGSGTTGTGLYAGQASQLSQEIISGWIFEAYKVVRNVATIIAFIFLLIFAFANILHIDINTYTIKKMIPNIIVAVLGAYLSIYAIMLISRGIDYLHTLVFFSPYNSLHPFYNIMSGNFGGIISTAASTVDTGATQAVLAANQNINSMALLFKLGGVFLGNTGQYSILSGIIGAIFLWIPAVVAFAFDYVLALRPIAVGLLTILSPVAFAAYIFPAGQTIFKKWVTFTLIALFYAPAVNLILYVVNQISPPGTDILFILMLLVKTAVFVFLIRMPFTIEADLQRISLALAKTNFGAALGFTKQGEQNVRIKQENKNIISDKNLGTREAQSIIAPTSKDYRRSISQTKITTNQKSRTLNQIFNRNQGPHIKNLDEVSDKANEANLARPLNVLTNSVSDLPPQAMQKIISSSTRTIFRDSPLTNLLKIKNGQLLDDQGAVTRADATRKVYRSAELVEQGKVGNPEAVKLLAQKQMLKLLPLEIIKKSLDSGIISKDDIQSNFKTDPQTALARINDYKRSKILSTDQLKLKLDQDFKDSKTGFTDLLYAIEANQERPAASPQETLKIIDNIKNQNQTAFDKNALYYLSRLSDINKQSKDNLAAVLESSGTPRQTAIAVSQNPGLNYNQIVSYIPKETTPQTHSAIKEIIGERDSSQTAINQVSSSAKEDKVMLGRVVAEKVSESLKTGNSRNFDGIKNEISSSLRNLSVQSNPQEVKAAAAHLENFAPGAIQTATAPTEEDIEKLKDKGEMVISTIDEMKIAGIDEKAVTENPQAAFDKYAAAVKQDVNNIASGKSKPKDEGLASKNASQTSNTIESTIGQAISSKTKGNQSFDQQLSDLSSKTQSGTQNG